jgi:MtN3 and saliva related transmembrane protein
MPFIDIVGYAAGLLILASMIPQIIKSWKTKSTKDLSLPMYIIYTCGIILWFVYGILLKNEPIIYVNALNLVLASTIVFLKMKNG